MPRRNPSSISRIKEIRHNVTLEYPMHPTVVGLGLGLWLGLGLGLQLGLRLGLGIRVTCTD